jgi:hydrogenase nickel incorporation protein HypA/HybF
VHEVSVAQRMVEIAVGAARDHGGRRVTGARLLLGELTCVDADTLTFAFDIVSRDTPAAGCKLDIVKVPLRLRCRACDRAAERGLGDPCPACGAPGGEVLAGRELRIETIDIDDEPGGSGGDT